MPTLQLPAPASLRPWALGLRIDEIEAGTLNRFPAMVEGAIVVVLEGAVAPDLDAAAGPLGVLTGPRSAPQVSLTLRRLKTLSVLLHPAAMARLAGISAQALADATIDLGDLWGTAWWSTRQRLADATSDRVRLACLLSVLRRHLLADGADTRARALALYRHAALPMAQASSRLGWSERQLERLFVAELGLGPKQFQRVLRFEHTLLQALLQPAVPLAQLALDGGYHDQAHMSHEFRRLCGHAPRELLQRLQAGDPEHWPIVHGWRFSSPGAA